MALISLLVHDKFQNRYLAANTHDAAYIIGGLYTKNLVAEFRDDQWAQLDDIGNILGPSPIVIFGNKIQKFFLL